MKEEILAALNNAVSRGESLEQAMQTLILAGYNSPEVQEAAKSVNMGVISSIAEQNEAINTATNLSNQATQESNKKNKKTLIMILAVLSFLLMIGLVGFIMFKDTILSMMFPSG